MDSISYSKYSSLNIFRDFFVEYMFCSAIINGIDLISIISDDTM